MKKMRIIAVVLLALAVLAIAMPASAAEKVNVMTTARFIDSVNVSPDKYSNSVYGGVSDPTKMIDGRYGVGPTNKDEGFNTRTIDKWMYHDADGKQDVNGNYLWLVTFQLDQEYTIDSLSLMTLDLSTCGIGSTNPVQWLQMGLAILVSDTGEAGSWEVAYEAYDLHTEDAPGAYTYVAPCDAYPMGYYQYTATFTPVKAKYIRYGCLDYTSYEIDQSHWINISELEIYGTAEEDPADTIPALPTPPVDPRNVMTGAVWSDSVNLRTCAYKVNPDGTKCDPSKMVDGKWAVGPTYKNEGLNTRLYDMWARYDADDFPADAGEYLWSVTFTLDRMYEVDSFRLINLDLTGSIGDSHTIQWFQRGFDILVSQTGAEGSWERVYRGQNLHTEDDPGVYVYHEATETNLAYYDMEADFNKSARARYIKFASTDLTTDVLYSSDWINISELQVFGEAVAGETPEDPDTPTTLPAGENVMDGARFIRCANLSWEKMSESVYGGVSDPTKMIDGRWGVGPTHKDEGLNTRVVNVENRYNADGVQDNSLYLWSATFGLEGLHQLNGFRLINLDLTDMGIGSTRTVQWFQRDFDILVSETGEAGSWRVVYEGRNLHTESDPGAYVYHPNAQGKLPYYDLTVSFAEAAQARFVQIASLSETSDVITSSHWVNISELEVYGEAIPMTENLSGTCGENLTWVLDTEGTLTISGTGKMDSWWGEGVYPPWQPYRMSIRKIVMEDGITCITDRSFYGYGYQNLESVYIPDSVSEIYSYAFGYLDAAIRIPGGLKYVSDNAFSYCTGITELPETATWEYIGGGAFQGCTGLADLVIPAGVTRVAANAFISCTSLTSVHIPASVVSLDSAAFAFCPNILNYSVAEDHPAYSVDEHGVLFNRDKTALILCPTGKTGKYLVPSTVTQIGENAFWNGGVTHVVCPSGVHSIGKYAFADCTDLVEIVLPTKSVSVGVNGIPAHTTIYSYEGSGAHRYAAQNGCPFVALQGACIRGRVTLTGPHPQTFISLHIGMSCLYSVSIPASMESGAQVVDFCFTDVAPGTYDLKILQINKLPFTVQGIPVTVGAEDLDLNTSSNALTNFVLLSGDVNGDGCIDLQDVTLLTSSETYSKSYADAKTKAADVNGDGLYDLQDLIIITSEKSYGKRGIEVVFAE